MKLLRYGPVGLERPGVLDHDGRVCDLSPPVVDITPEVAIWFSTKTDWEVEMVS
jgi:2,4-diketo-3-deoxy-L-fuconate hydrolase